MEKEQIAKTASFAQTPGCIDTMAQLDDTLLIDESHSEMHLQLQILDNQK